MPYLQLDLPAVYPAEVKRRLAKRIGLVYADVMQTTPEIVKVAFRELGPDNLYRCSLGEPQSVVVLMCDIRRGRPASQRQAVATALVSLCAEELHIEADQIEVEFTQHAGDEMYRHGKLVADWEPEETARTRQDS